MLGMANRRFLLYPLLLVMLTMTCTSTSIVKPQAASLLKKPEAAFRQGLWIRAASIASPEAINRLIHVVKRMNITDVFVQVVVGGYAYYDSHILPRSQYLSKISGSVYDPLDSILKIFSQTPVHVHAWVNTLLYWSLEEPPESLNHIYYVHPDWFMLDVNRISMNEYSYTEWKNMGLEGIYLDPENPEVARFVQSVCTEIVARYPVDGIHLDFLRYPGILWGLPDKDGAALLAGIDASEVSWCNLVRYARLPFMQRWVVWHTWQMTRNRPWVIECIIDSIIQSAAHHALKRNCQVSAAVFANPAFSRFSFAQDWTEWNRDGFLPIVMSYTPDVTIFKDYVNFSAAHRADALMGIGLIWSDMRQTARWQADYVKNNEGAGICYFDFAAIDTMLDQLSSEFNAVRREDLKTDTNRYEALTDAFADLPDPGFVEQGRHFCTWGIDLDFTAHLLSLSLNPTRDLARMGLSRQDFITFVTQDVAAFEYLDREIFPIGEELIEPPRRSIRYAYVPWSDADSLAVVERAKKTSALDKKADFYPMAGDPLTKAVFNAQICSDEILITPAGVYVFVVDSVHSAGERQNRTELPTELIPVYLNWTINTKVASIMKNIKQKE
jgi:uncharacterized lipoprotein YddW (UPF0748 family)